MSGAIRPAAYLENVTQRYGRVVALDDVTAVLPAGYHGWAHRRGRSGQVDAPEHHRRRPAGAIGGSLRARRRHHAPRRTAPQFAPASPTCRRAWERTFIRTSASARTSNSSPVCSGNRARSGTERSAQGSSPLPIVRRRSFRRHAAKARTLFAHSRPDLLILDEPTTGVDPLSRRQIWSTYSRAPHRHEHGSSHRLHGRGRAIRFTDCYERSERSWRPAC